MSLNDIELPAFVIQDLFQKTLVDMSGNEKEQIVSASEELNFFGGNKQHIILLVNNPDTAFVTDQQLTFLSGILNACKLTLEDIGLLNIASYPAISYKTISEALTPRIIMLFGISTDSIQLPFLMPDFQRQSYNNQVYLVVPTLHALENDKNLKRKLWAVLQQIFSL
ncbi:MAG: hypothetical protein ABIQ07_08875 [Ginsengibacter sp.]